MILTFLVIMTMCFVLIKLLPLPAVKEQGRDVQLVLQRREAMGYNKPIMTQYYLYWRHILTAGDFGVGELDQRTAEEVCKAHPKGGDGKTGHVLVGSQGNGEEAV